MVCMIFEGGEVTFYTNFLNHIERDKLYGSSKAAENKNVQ